MAFNGECVTSDGVMTRECMSFQDVDGIAFDEDTDTFLEACVELLRAVLGSRIIA